MEGLFSLSEKGIAERGRREKRRRRWVEERLAFQRKIRIQR